MKECSDVLNTISIDDLNDFEKELYSKIRIRMENNDNKVFLMKIVM
jgi:hypothetical protein